MRLNWLNNLTPNAKKVLMVGTAATVLFSALYLVVSGTDSKEAPIERINVKENQVVNVLTSGNTKNLGLDAIAGRIKLQESQIKDLSRRIEQLLHDRDADRRDNAVLREWNEKLDSLNNEVTKLRAEQRDSIFRGGYAVQSTQGSASNANEAMGEGNASGTRVEQMVIANPFEEREIRMLNALKPSLKTPAPGFENQTPPESHSVGGVESGTSASVSSRATSAKGTKKGSKSIRINVTAEAKTTQVSHRESVRERLSREAKEKAKSTVIPAGSIMTGTIITGADFPTGKGSYDNPTPTLIRLTKDVILPNRFKTDIRECFMLAGGRGDLSSERALLRTESLSCIRNDGGIINTKISGYIAGEDGKAGIRGRLVSKQGQMIARTLVAGFLSGMSDAFDYTPVSVLDTSSVGNHVSYQSKWSADAAKGGLASGASKALEKVADFYMKLADSMVPVIEIGAGREVEVITIAPVTLTVGGKNQINETGVPDAGNGVKK